MTLPFHGIEKKIFAGGALVFILSLITALITEQLYFVGLPFALVMLYVFLKDIRWPFLFLMAAIPFSMNLQERVGVNIDFPDELMMLLLTFAFSLFALYNKSSIDIKQWFKNPIIKIILLAFLWMVISVICSMDPIFSAKYMFKRIWFLVPFLFLPLVLFKEVKIIQLSFTAMSLTLVSIVVIVLVRYQALGFRFEDVHDPIQPFFINHVMYGSMISCFVTLVFGALMFAKRWTIKWFTLLACLFILLIGVYFSYSRAAWMAVLFACGAFICIKFKVMHYAMAVFYAIVLVAILWLSKDNQYLNYRPKFEKTIMHESLGDHIMATIQGTDISSAERYYRWIAAVRMSVDHPIVGVGPNNFYSYYKAYTIAAYRTWVSRNLEKSTTHNYFLFMLVEQGYPALILYALLIIVIFFYGQKVYHRTNEKLGKIIVMSSLCMIAALFINNFFSELLETDKIGSLFLLGIAAIIATDWRLNKQDNPKIPT